MLEYLYDVTIGFADMPDIEAEFEINASEDADESEILKIIKENTEILSIITLSEINKTGNNTWDVIINFCDLCSNVYTVEADNENDAIDEAIDSAKSDLTVIDFELIDEVEEEEYEEAEDDEDDYDWHSYGQHSEEWYIARDNGEDTEPYV